MILWFCEGRTKVHAILGTAGCRREYEQPSEHAHTRLGDAGTQDASHEPWVGAGGGQSPQVLHFGAVGRV